MGGDLAESSYLLLNFGSFAILLIRSLPEDASVLII